MYPYAGGNSGMDSNIFICVPYVEKLRLVTCVLLIETGILLFT